MQTHRTFNIGRKKELEDRLATLRVEIDASAKAIVLHFEPMDIDCKYVEKIDPFKLETYVHAIARKKKDFDRIKAEVDRLNAELGE